MFETTEFSSLSERRADATRDAIVEAAWRLSRERGLTGWSLRELAQSVGVKAPTLYAYVDSKHAIYDQMFREGWNSLSRLSSTWSPTGVDDRTTFKRAMHEFFEFCSGDPTRYHLMFQRVIPDFEPSPAAYAASIEAYERFRAQMADLGVTKDADLDLWTAISTGLTSQQITNDLGGDRWVRLLDEAVDMYCDHVGIEPATSDNQAPANRRRSESREGTDHDTDNR